MDPGSGHEFDTRFSASTRGGYYGRHVTFCQWSLIHTVQSSFRVNFLAFPACRVFEGYKIPINHLCYGVTIKGSLVSILSRRSLFADSHVASRIV